MNELRLDAQVVGRLTPAVLAALRRYGLSRDDQLDILQTVWMRLLLNSHTIRDPDRLVGWLCTTARREAVHLLRGLDRERRYWQRIADTEAPVPAVNEHLLRGARDDALWTVVSRLPPGERQIVALLAAEPGITCRGLAEQLGLSASAATRLRARALRRLRRMLAAEGITSP